MEKCYQYLGCNNKSCVMHGVKDKHCWEMDGTLCNHHGIKIVRERYPNKNKEYCCARSSCIYYRAVK